MKSIISLLFLLVVVQVKAQVPKDMQGFWQFDVNKPGDWNGFHLGEDYIENFYQIYKIKSVDRLSGKIKITLDMPNEVFFEFLDNSSSPRKVRISSRKDTLLCTYFEKDPDILHESIAPLAYAGTKWRSTKNLNDELIFDKDVIKIGNELWKVKWFGKYKINGEHRALVEKDGTHRLFYLKSNPNSLKLDYNFKASFYVEESKFPEVYDFIGNWYNPTNNSWDYGFFENFAIIKGVPINYKRIEKNKKGYTVRFDSEDYKKPLHIAIADGSITIDKVKYSKVNKFLPNYAGKDTTSFKDTKFQSLDTAIITGYLRGNTSKDPFKIELRNWLTTEYDSFYGDIDEYGLFTIKVPLYNTSQVYGDWRRAFFLDVLSPGEQYFVYKDLQTGETVFYGDNARLHNELSRYHEYTSKNNINPKSDNDWRRNYNYENSLKDTALLKLKVAQLDSLRVIDKVFVDNNNLSAKSLYYIDSHNKFKIASYLMQKRFDLDRQNGEEFSDEYMRVVKEQFFDNNIAPLSLIRENATFLTDYIGYKEEYEMPEGSSVNHSMIISKLFEKGIIPVDEKLQKFAKFTSLIDLGNTDLSNDVDVNLILKDTLLSKEYSKIAKDNAELIHKYTLHELFVVNSAKGYAQIIQGGLLDLFLTRSILQRYKYSPVALDEYMLAEALAPIHSTYYKTVIRNKNDELITLANAKLTYEDNLKNTNHLKESKDADKIIVEILSPHKGKVVYMDFWGTWCGPCVVEMEYAPAAKKAFEDKDVVFVYMANGTAKTEWENFIKANDLEGKNVYHYNLPQLQQSMVERRLGVPHFPTYMLFDKEGNLVNPQAPRPSSLDALQIAIDKLL